MRKFFVKNRVIKHKDIITKVGKLTGEQMESVTKDTSNVIVCLEKLTNKKLDDCIIGYSSLCYKNCKIGEVYKEESKENGITYYVITDTMTNNMYYCYSIY